MDVKGSSKPHELSYEQVAALKDVKDMTVDERKARDVGGLVPGFCHGG